MSANKVLSSIKWLPIRLSLALLLSLSLPFLASAQIPIDDVLKEFKVNGDFLITANGQTMEAAEIFFSQRAVAYLVVSPNLSSPLLVQLRARTIESVGAEKITHEDDGSRAVLADAELAPAGVFTLNKQEVLFKFDDKELVLKPRPWLLGKQQAAKLKKHNPEYAFKASKYAPSAEAILALKGETRAVKIRVYFGSWCPHCKEMVPRILRVEEELGDAKINFEYFGLFSPLSQDGQAKADKVHGVPTAVVYIDGQEVHRVDARGLVKPEKTLVDVLSQQASAPEGNSD